MGRPEAGGAPGSAITKPTPPALERTLALRSASTSSKRSASTALERTRSGAPKAALSSGVAALRSGARAPEEWRFGAGGGDPDMRMP